MLGVGLRVVRLTIITSPYVRGGAESSEVNCNVYFSTVVVFVSRNRIITS